MKRNLLILAAIAAALATLAASILPKRTPVVDQFLAADYVTHCGSGWQCTNSMIVNQFDPALGTLMGISYTLTDTQTITYFYNDSMVPSGEPFSIQIHHELFSAALQFGTGAVTNVDGFVTGLGLSKPMTDIVKLRASGALPPLAYFIGQGTVPVDLVDEELAFDSLPSDNFADILTTQDQIKLDLKYWYKPLI